MTDQTSTLSESAPLYRFYPPRYCGADSNVYKHIMGNSSLDVAKHIMRELLPPFTADAIIHDNGCGTGEVTSQIMETNPPPPKGIVIKATEKDEYKIGGCRERVRFSGWPVEVMAMPAQSISFPDEYFTHSFANFVVPHLEENHDPAAKHIYRTLKKGGVAIVTTWAEKGHFEAIKNAHLLTRGPDVNLPLDVPDRWYKQSALKEFLLVGGFKEENIKFSTCSVYCMTRDLPYLMAATWSYLGKREDGWYESDGENWDKVVDMLVKEVEAGPYYCKGSGETVGLIRVANIALATK